MSADDVLIEDNDLLLLKKQAKKLKKLSGIKHREALEKIACENGFDNWKQVTDCYKKTKANGNRR